MQDYCKNCGSRLEENAVFCPECGTKIEKRLCPNCGEDITNSDNFCENCGENLNDTPKVNNELLKDKRPIIMILIIIIAILLIMTAPTLIKEMAGSQTVSVDSYNFKIPAYFEFNKTASEKGIEGVPEGKITQKVWNSSGEHIRISIMYFNPSTDVESILVSLGGYRDNMFGINGHHYHFQDGDESFSYADGNKMISIMVSDGNLYNKIEVGN